MAFFLLFFLCFLVVFVSFGLFDWSFRALLNEKILAGEYFMKFRIFFIDFVFVESLFDMSCFGFGGFAFGTGVFSL